MPDTYHNIQFKQTPTFDPPNEPTFSDMQMIVWVKNLQADPVPTAPVFDATMILADTVVLDPLVDDQDIESDYTDGIRTTLFYYDFNPDWTFNTDRYSDASAPFPTLPTNVYNFEYKDKRDDFQGWTSRVWFTTA